MVSIATLYSSAGTNVSHARLPSKPCGLSSYHE
jgi:hypothetical protein